MANCRYRHLKEECQLIAFTVGICRIWVLVKSLPPLFFFSLFLSCSVKFPVYIHLQEKKKKPSSTFKIHLIFDNFININYVFWLFSPYHLLFLFILPSLFLSFRSLFHRHHYLFTVPQSLIEAPV